MIRNFTLFCMGVVLGMMFPEAIFPLVAVGIGILFFVFLVYVLVNSRGI